MKRIVFTLSLLLAALTMQAQYVREDAPPPQATQGISKAPIQGSFWDKVSIGGGFGLQFFTGGTFIGLSPLFNYHPTDNFVFGIGPMYQYLNLYDQAGDNFTSVSYGGRISASYFLPGRLSNLFIHGEYDVMNVPDFYSVFTNLTRVTLSFPLAGLGIRRQLSDKSCYYFLCSWNFNNTPLAPYLSNPVIEAGLDFGI